MRRLLCITLLAFGLTPAIASAGPVHVVLDQTVNAGQAIGDVDIFDLDLDADGTDDLTFVSQTTQPTARTEWAAFVQSNSGTTRFLAGGARLSAGDAIGAGGNYSSAPAYFVQTFFSPDIYIQGLWRQSNQPGTTGFLGIELDIGGNAHYGWIQIEVPREGVFFDNEIRVIDFAYESVAGAVIQAGTTTGGASNVPAPSAVALLLIGLLAGSARRARSPRSL